MHVTLGARFLRRPTAYADLARQSRTFLWHTCKSNSLASLTGKQMAAFLFFAELKGKLLCIENIYMILTTKGKSYINKSRTFRPQQKQRAISLLAMDSFLACT